MQSKIRILSDETINQIAAGEVIESPASVVKELIENALDANASKITVEITGGGLKLIRVSDDGTGMDRLDAKCSILRHATSKITHAQDLFHIKSKGFRGEALASIASISKMTMMTSFEGIGTKLEIEKGEIVKEGRCARNRGTTIEVSSLFYNIPARKKFQKTAAAISAEIFRMVTVMSLSCPEVCFELISNGRKAIKMLPLSGSFEEIFSQRAKELLGNDFIMGSFPLYFKEGSLEFYGLLGAPTNTRNNKMGQHLFLNRRAVSCTPIEEAVRAGYGTRLDEKRHPIFLLYLDVPADLVDVNVHPQKLQVRLRKENLFREKVAEAVEKAFSKRVEPLSVNREGFTPLESIDVNFEEISLRFNESESLEEPDLPLEQEEFQVMGRVGRFLFLHDQSSDQAVIMDVEAARFRVIFEDLRTKGGEGVEKQGLLVPFSIDFTPIEAAMVLTHMEAIEKLGFVLRPIGKEVFMVEAMPSFIDESAVNDLIADLAHSLQEFIGKIDYEKERKEKLSLVAAQRVKGKIEISKEEAKQLFKQLRACKSPLHSPKGDPTMVVLSHDEIEDLFTTHQASAKSAQR